MRWIQLLIAALCMTWAGVASAETWRHERSGISIEIPANLRLGQVSDPNRDGSDVAVQLGDGQTAVTFFVYRAAYPNVALWYDRARSALNVNFRLSGAGSPRPFALAGASAPNGLREELDLPEGRARATAIALAGYGEWLIKMRITSAALGREEVTRLMDALLAGILPGATASSPLLSLPENCPANVSFNSRPLRERAGPALAQGLQSLEAAVRGRSGLAADPVSWCRMRTDLPASTYGVFGRRDNGGWVVLLGDAGAAMTALRPAGGADGPVAVYGSNASGNRLLSLHEGVPAPAPEVERDFRSVLTIRGNGT